MTSRENSLGNVYGCYVCRRPREVAEGFLTLIEDDTKNGKVMRVRRVLGIDYQQYSDEGI